MAANSSPAGGQELRVPLASSATAKKPWRQQADVLAEHAEHQLHQEVGGAVRVHVTHPACPPIARTVPPLISPSWGCASRASRVLAVHQTHQIGLQVKRIKRCQVYIAEREIGRMRSDARSLGWHAAFAFDLDGMSRSITSMEAPTALTALYGGTPR